MLVMPADHIVETADEFQQAIGAALESVDRDPERLVTFGIVPTYPAQVFGYIQRGAAGSDQARGIYEVKRFREKPDAETAKKFLESGDFYWNAGIFVWKAATILAALEQFEPEMAAHLSAIADTIDTADFSTTLDREFQLIAGKSIDFAVMERHPKVTVIEAPFRWDDLGNWTALARLVGQDEQGNTIVGKNLTIDSRNSIIRSDDRHLVVALGVENCIIVHTPDATLIARRDDEEGVRRVVEELKLRGWDEYL